MTLCTRCTFVLERSFLDAGRLRVEWRPLAAQPKGDTMRATHSRWTMATTLLLGTALGLALCAPPAAAADSQRTMHWQFSVPITFTSGGTFDAEAGTKVDVSDDLGWRFAFGNNLSENLFLGMEFTWLSANYDASIATDNNSDFIPDTVVTVSGTLDTGTLAFVGQYNILPRNITPFVRGSFGWTWVDSNIPAGPTQGACWWDPWFGYICDTWQPTFGDTAFSYGVAGGIHATLTPTLFVEASYNVLWLDLSKSSPNFDGFRLNVGWTY